MRKSMQKYKEADIVECFKGTKSGIGKIIALAPEYNGYLVEFPKETYPVTMVVISGTYYIPEDHIMRKIEMESYTCPACKELVPVGNHFCGKITEDGEL